MDILQIVSIIFGAAVIIQHVFLVVKRSYFYSSISEVEKNLTSYKTEILFSDELVKELPPVARQYFLHAIKSGSKLATQAHLKMEGMISLNSKWIRFSAEETIGKYGFVWKAYMVVGGLPVRGGDYYYKNQGHVRFMILDVYPVANASGIDIAKSAMGRLIAEFVWLPSAFLLHDVEWSEIDSNKAKAIVNLDGEKHELEIEVNESGKLKSVKIMRWGDATDDETWQWIPFGGEVIDEREFNGVTIPVIMEVGYWFGTEKYSPFFRVKISDAHFE